MRSTAVLALAGLHDGRAFALLVATLSVEEPVKRRFLSSSLLHLQAINGLTDLGDPRAVEPLLTALQKEEGYTRTRAVDTLAGQSFATADEIEQATRITAAQLNARTRP